ncbi:hydrogenase formation protein HypD [Candidatus Kuenenbacteria bacterium HGW-Kuenenbacteria-1]|uniref:Hydrogenase formation protein HypD n=1 Tax=Candidatus Kuenenbacteria bacterium HGW-Kuenenbacteria-1 TaxID=2013812 RepID=A0A2N1UNM2_9BACT|nr:MAG: hydrogenase formation protein HypD [Candidatus Kuenenbacteria bacterium HGW-Kuenenbacteria-1]
MKIIIKKINAIAVKIKKNINIMEVCGTHTEAVAKFGLRELMPKNIKLTTGPGCPVCVTAQKDIDAIVNLALSGIPVATYGDMMRVPGYYGSLDQAREKGASVFIVYSVDDCLKLQKKYSNLVFFGLGFETTAPMTAYAIKKGLTVYSTHKLFLPAMQALLKIGELKIDGYLCPGHVSTIIGTEPYKTMKVPQVIAGFEAEDILVSIYMLLKQIFNNKANVENEYLRSVKKQGNPKAIKEIFDVFDVADGNWRGFGIIPKSGLEIKNKYEKFNAKIKYKKILDKIDFSHSQKSVACICGEIIRGLKQPKQCSLFKKVCTSENPIGPCMVSMEGACNVFYRYKK